MKRILIFSRRCQSSSNLITLLKNMNLLIHFEMICIEDLIQQNKQLPPNIKTVPALVLPEISSILQGRETFDWVEKMRISMIKINISKNAQQNGPHGFANNEMAGNSDNFAYTMTDIAQPKSFLPYGKDDEYEIFTGKEAGKLKKEDINKLIRDNEKSRKDQDNKIEELYENTRRDAIVNNEKQKLMATMM